MIFLKGGFIICLVLCSGLFAQSTQLQHEKDRLLDRKTALQNEISRLKQIVDKLHSDDLLLNPDECKDEIFDIVEATPADIQDYAIKVLSFETKIRNGSKLNSQELEDELTKIRLNKISALPEFYEDVHIYLPTLLNEQQENKMVQENNVEYEVKKGDNLWKIAEMIKDPYFWKNIYEFNKEIIKNPDVIYPKQKLNIPHEALIEFADNLNEHLTPIDSIQSILTPEEQTKEIKKLILADDIEIEGLIVDETSTKIGRDFYELFYSKLSSMPAIKRFTIIIAEKTARGLGTQISIKINDNEIWQNFLQPRYDIIEELSMNGARATLSYVENYDQIQTQIKGDDLQGTGIY